MAAGLKISLQLQKKGEAFAWRSRVAAGFLCGQPNETGCECQGAGFAGFARNMTRLSTSSAMKA
jgi:hypothetical protein